mgnify:CR=1 FL=1
MEIKKRLEKIKRVTIERPYCYFFLVIFIGYIVINIVVNKIYISAPILLTYNLKIIIPYIFLTILTSILVSININLVYNKVKELKSLNKSSGFSFLGIFGGLLGGGCPSCFVGLFPAFLGLFGITASLSSLPFFGLEILVGSVVLLMLSIFLLTKDSICNIKYGKNDKV